MSDNVEGNGPISLLDICTNRVARLLLENTLPQSQGTAVSEILQSVFYPKLLRAHQVSSLLCSARAPWARHRLQSL